MVPTAKSPSRIAAAPRTFSYRGELLSGERWYVVRALPKREQGAEAQLAGQGFRVFLPKVSRNVRHARKTKAVHAPAFPGYLFVALDLQRDRWRSINGTFGVMSLIMTEERPRPVPRGVVETIIDYMPTSPAFAALIAISRRGKPSRDRRAAGRSCRRTGPAR